MIHGTLGGALANARALLNLRCFLFTGLIPLFIYARQHPTNIILLAAWVSPHMPKSLQPVLFGSQGMLA